MSPEKRHGDCKLSIIIPVYNEERRLPNCLDSLLSFYDKTMEVEVIVSEDGSNDNSFAIAKEYASRNVCVKVVHSEERLGKGGGIINGLQEAVGNLVMFMDVDLSTKPDQIPRLERAIIEGADLAVGSRSLPQSTITQSRSFTRKVLAEGFNWLFRSFFRIQIRDTQCGFKMMKNEIFKELMDKIEIKGFAFDVDLIVKAHDRGYNIREVPIVWSPTSGSKIRIDRQVLEMARDLLKIWWLR